MANAFPRTVTFKIVKLEMVFPETEQGAGQITVHMVDGGHSYRFNRTMPATIKASIEQWVENNLPDPL